MQRNAFILFCFAHSSHNMSTEDMREILAFFQRFQAQNKNQGKGGQDCLQEESSDLSGDDGVACTLQHLCNTCFVASFYVPLHTRHSSEWKVFINAL
jgi:hypothetical protein